MQEPPFDTRIRLSQYADAEEEWNWIADGVGVDFSGCTASFGLRVVPSDPAPLFPLITTTPSDSGLIVLGTPMNEAGVGRVQLVVARAVATLLTCVVAHGDLLITWPNGAVTKFAHIDADIELGSTW